MSPRRPPRSMGNPSPTRGVPPLVPCERLDKPLYRPATYVTVKTFRLREIGAIR